MHRYSLALAFATLCLHLLFDSTSCSVDICSPLICRSDLPASRSEDESSGSGAVGLQYVLDVEQQETHVAVEISISGSWHYTDPGPSGYMLDVFEEGNPERYIGKFADPDPQSSASACSEDKTVMFKSCQPSVLDLPGKYQWTPTEDVSRPICFRATIQNAEDSSCRTIIECRSFNLSSIEPEQEPTDSVPSLIVSNVTPSPELVAKCHKKHNCTGTKLKDFCCTDGKTQATYASRCHKRIAECSYKVTLQCHKGQCPEPEPEPIVEGPCIRDAAWYQWNVMCKCDGYFKPIQCHANFCWCVNKVGDQSSAAVPFEGSDKLSLSCF